MADKHSVKKIQLEKTLILPSEGIPLASKRLDALCEEFRREKLDKIHKKRRRKYNKRHKLESSRPGKLTGYISCYSYASTLKK